MDGVDAVAVQINGHGLKMTASFLSMNSRSLGTTQQKLQSLAIHGGTTDEMEIAALEVGRITRKTIEELHLQQINLIALHGQTVFHQPPASIQLIDANQITPSFNCKVLTDPRQQDLQHGGQGAPITPLADWIMFRDEHLSTAIVNLGGFCNVTLLPANSTPKDVTGFDVCCCNLLLNAIATQMLGQEFDKGGKSALLGKPDSETTQLLLDKLTEQRTSGRSLGTNDDLGAFALQLGKHLSPEDLLASATSAIGMCITSSIFGIDRVFLSGGGTLNESLARSIQHDDTTQALDVPIQAREGMAMAILGALSQDGVSITLPQITGRRESEEVVGWTQASP
jgi:anhydro-N-acetylmuramic acid kinase